MTFSMPVRRAALRQILEGLRSQGGPKEFVVRQVDERLIVESPNPVRRSVREDIERCGSGHLDGIRWIAPYAKQVNRHNRAARIRLGVG